ncbi:hypothetical protein KPH14_011213 [Odynerus spinipes]|uniref:isopentenyl-diphosphate Delta-isomerase n=1 Tax=Odynerus spinipes TaxID=1348599 RepID=A0AAD9R9C3_9HYME|nr:hypothetical protein KPH14_011213 [Odynerus spinipes]
MMAKVSKSMFSVMQKITSTKRYYGMAKIAPLQKAALEERCILVDELDRPVGDASKYDCHRVTKDGNLPLHRAFSVFLFNYNGDLLLQKRSDEKITFPGHYTNTCCSHPLAEIPGETSEDNAMGIRRAAQRRLAYELGIPSSEIELSDFFYISRVHYFSLGNGVWGEHEIDYVLFVQKDNITLDPNPDEISEIQWVSRKKIDEFTRCLIMVCNRSLSPVISLKTLN